jgi:hypothetical protein
VVGWWLLALSLALVVRPATASLRTAVGAFLDQVLPGSPRYKFVRTALVMARVVLNLCLMFAVLGGAWSSADVRLVDAAGSLSSVGLLQVNTDAGFGSVCGANAAAADAARPRVYYGIFGWHVMLRAPSPT